MFGATCSQQLNAPTGFMTSDIFDPDEGLHQSPKLKPLKINYKREESPPPYLPDSSSHSSSSSSSDSDRPNRPAQPGGSRKRSKRRVKSRTRPSQGDAVLVSYLGNHNRPDIAQEVGQRPLNSASQSEAESDEEMVIAPVIPAKDAAATAQAALSHLSTGDDRVRDGLTAQHAIVDGVKHALLSCVGRKHGHDGNVNKPLPAEDAAKDLLHLSSPKSTRPVPKVSTNLQPQQDDSLATSPNLAKFAITASESSNKETLPALQKSPPRSSSTHSPEGSQSLPSLQTALGSQLVDSPMKNGSPYPPVSATSPTIARPALASGPSPYLPPSMGPSPSSYASMPTPSSKDSSTMSPPSCAPSHPTYWRNPPKSEPSYGAVSGSDGFTPSSTDSPSTVYTTPGGQERKMSIDGDRPALLNGPLPPNGPFNSTGFKCTYPGCSAAPFQTQYLLNSHANVHSSNRPHYCPVKECPRGPGGKGFKRKNEMIRHGLVHDSPGYVCPFCPDQQHRYPRPDNLQRYVNSAHLPPHSPSRRRRMVGSQTLTSESMQACSRTPRRQGSR